MSRIFKRLNQVQLIVEIQQFIGSFLFLFCFIFLFSWRIAQISISRENYSLYFKGIFVLYIVTSMAFLYFILTNILPTTVFLGSWSGLFVSVIIDEYYLRNKVKARLNLIIAETDLIELNK